MGTAREIRMNWYELFFSGIHHMDVLVLPDQQGLTNISTERTLDAI